MKFTATSIPYRTTGLFSDLVNDYVEAKGTTSDYVTYQPNFEGIKKAIQQRNFSATQRKILVQVLNAQYQHLKSNKSGINEDAFEKVQVNIDLLKSENTFAVTTAHQPNLFTGPLYYFYKIIHAIQLADALKKQFPSNNFVPVYYMGSEDADIKEVGSFTIDGKVHQWETKQTGAIGRMKVDENLLQLLQNLEGYWGVKKEGKAEFEVLRKAYQKGTTISDATLQLMHAYFGKYGLVIVQPDDKVLKSSFNDVMEKELRSQFSHEAIQTTIQSLAKSYHVQTEGRPINLFYLKDDTRNRIEKKGEQFMVVDTQLQFSESEMIQELHDSPERFSPNVILRGVFQETIIPSIAFIGGGGELAYWMELKNVFNKVGVDYPVLILRNSFLFIREKQWNLWNSMQINVEDLFKPTLELEMDYVKKQASENLTLTEHLKSLSHIYQNIQQDVIKIDTSLGDHAFNLSVQAQKKLSVLEKKMLKAEKRKQQVSLLRIQAIKLELFPNNSLQERVENFSEWVGDYGWDWVDAILEHSNAIDPKFTIISVNKS